VDIELTYLLAAFGGGLFGAAVGGQPSFILTGFAAMIGVALVLAEVEFNWIGIVTFGPIFGPHIAFGGGVAAAAYAARRGNLSSGRDIATPVMGDPMALLVGGAFGIFGYLCNQFLAGTLLDGASWTDTIAVTVAVSAIVVRLVFGTTGMFGTVAEDHETGRLSVSSSAVWVGHQGAWVVTAVLSLGTGLLGAFAMVAVFDVAPDLANSVRVLVYASSAASLLLLQFGQPGPVTHHMTLCGAVVAGTMLAAGADPTLALIVGALAGGVGSGLLGELSARVFLIHGDTHIDPPAIAIAIVTSLTLLADSLI
jgi:hypothetical protein